MHSTKGLIIVALVVLALIALIPKFTSQYSVNASNTFHHYYNLASFHIDTSRVDTNGNKIADSLEIKLSAGGSFRVIILTKELPYLTKTYQILAQKAKIYKIWDRVLYGFSALASSDVIKQLVYSDDIILVEEDMTAKVQMVYTAQQIGVRPLLWDLGYEGAENISVAIVDTGIDPTHPAFAENQIIGWYDVINGNATPYDDNGHGTLCASIVAGQGFSSLDEENYTVSTISSSNYMYAENDSYVVLSLNATGEPSVDVRISIEWYNKTETSAVLSLILYYGNSTNESDWIIADEIITQNKNTTYWLNHTGSPGFYHVAINLTTAESLGKVAFRISVHWNYSTPDSYTKWRGIAPKVKLVGVKVANADGFCFVSDIVDGLNWIVTNKETFNISVVLMSLGTLSESASLEEAVNNVISSGILVVAAAGNFGPTGKYVAYPAAFPRVIAVAALNTHDQIAYYSSKGGIYYDTMKPDIAAPGGSYITVSVFAADTNYNDNGWSNELIANDSFGGSGTSISAAIVAGAAALLIGALGGIDYWGNWSIENVLKIKQVLLMTASETAPLKREIYQNYSPTLDRGFKDEHEGYGRLNTYAALDALLKTFSINESGLSGDLYAPTDAFLNMTNDFAALSRHVWSRKVFLYANTSYVFALNVSSSADFDIYIYDLEPNEIGEPVLLDQTVEGTGEKSLLFTPPHDGYYYVVIKAISGNSTFNLTSWEDPNAPRVNILSPQQYAIISENFTVWVNGTDADGFISAMYISIDDTKDRAMIPYNSTHWYYNVSITDISTGNHTLYIKAIDNDDKIVKRFIHICTVANLTFFDDAENSTVTALWSGFSYFLWCGVEGSGVYRNNLNNVTIRMKNAILLGSTPATLIIQHKYDIRENDTGYIEISTDAGLTWAVLRAYNGTTSDIKRELISLASFAGSSVLLRFKFYSDDAENSSGWFIDYVKIIQGKRVLFYDGFDNLDLWTDESNGEWHITGVGWHLNDTRSYSPSHAYRFASGALGNNSLDLEGKLMVCLDLRKAYSNGFINFMISGGIDIFDSFMIKYSLDFGISWNTLVTYGYSYNSSFISQSIQLSDECYKSIVIIAFVFKASPYSSASSHKEGVFLDDINITASLDFTPPSTSFGSYYYSSGGNNYVSGNSPIVLNAADSESGVNKTLYKINNSAWYEYTGPFSMQSYAENQTYTLYFYSIDNVGNVEEIKNFTFILDNTPPSSQISYTPVYNNGTYVFVNETTQFTLTASDAISGVKEIYYYVTGSPLIYTGPFTLASYPEGVLTIHYYASDNVNNLEDENTETVYLDKSPPVSQINYTPLYSSGGIDYVNESVKFSITSTDASGILAIYYSIDGGPFVQYTAPFTLAGYSEGLHTITFYAIDNTYHNESQKSITVYLDKTPPTASITYDYYSLGGTDYVGPSTSFTITGDDGGGSGIASLYYRVDGGTWIIYTAPFTLSSYSESLHTIDFYAVDNIGLQSTISTVSVYLDKTPPDTIISFEAVLFNGTYYFVNETTVFTLTSSDTLSNVSEILYRIDNGTWIDYSVPFTLSALDDGVHTIYFYAIDNVNNSEPINSTTIFLDKSPPEISISITISVFTNNTFFVTHSSEITIIANDPSGVHNIIYRVNSSTNDTGWLVYGAPFNLSGYPEGPYKLFIQAKDNMNHTSDIKSYSLYIDISPPEISYTVINAVLEGGVYVAESSAVLKINASDRCGVAHVFYRINGSEWQIYTKEIELSVGNHTIDFYATDGLNNTGSIVTLTIAVLAPPSAAQPVISSLMPIFIIGTIIIVVVIAMTLVLRRRTKGTFFILENFQFPPDINIKREIQIRLSSKGFTVSKVFKVTSLGQLTKSAVSLILLINTRTKEIMVMKPINVWIKDLEKLSLLKEKGYEVYIGPVNLSAKFQWDIAVIFPIFRASASILLEIL